MSDDASDDERASGGGRVQATRPRRVRLAPYATELMARKNRKARVAVYTNNVELVERLLDEGADPNWRDEHSRSLLHLAACCGFDDAVRALIERGADPNARDSLGNTPLHLAACTRHTAVVIRLLDAGTDVSSLNRLGRSPVQLAQSRLKIIHMRKRGDDVTNPDTQRLVDEIKLIVEMMTKYLRARNQDASDMEALAQSLEKVSTEDQVDDQVSLLLQKLKDVDISK